MKLYYAPGACSLASRIALVEARLPAKFERVDLSTRRTETGEDFQTITPKGYVPALALDDGEIITESVAVLTWIAEASPSLLPPGRIGRIRLIEALTYLSTELHRAFKPMWHAPSHTARENAARDVAQLLDTIARSLVGPYLFGGNFSAADAYLFVMLAWARRFGIQAPAPLVQFHRRMMGRAAVQSALEAERPKIERSSFVPPRPVTLALPARRDADAGPTR